MAYFVFNIPFAQKTHARCALGNWANGSVGAAAAGPPEGGGRVGAPGLGHEPGPGRRLIKVGLERRWEAGLLAELGRAVEVLCWGWGDGGWSACVRAR
eukprot:scaffold39474_cov54-Phaeocystis_antarctica.AAC.1